MIKEHTLGSETSQYQEEKKQICISLVAASEKEEAQTLRFDTLCLTQGKPVIILWRACPERGAKRRVEGGCKMTM